MTGSVDAFRQSLRVIVRQLSRNRRRTGLTFFGLVISFFLYTGLQTLLTGLVGVIEQSGSDTILVTRSRNEVGLVRPQLPRSYAARMREIQGIAAASPVRLYLGQGRRDGVPAIALGVEIDRYFDIQMPDSVNASELSQFRARRGVALAGAGLLQENSWSVGDRITLRPLGPGNELTLDLVGDIAASDRLGNVLLVDIDYLEGVLGDAGRTSLIQARVQTAAVAAPLAREIDARFAGFSVPTETATERTHMSTVLTSLSEAFGALRAIAYLTLAVTMLVVGNSVSMSIRERTVEIGTLRALGFSKGWIARMVLGEAMLVSLLGGFAGSLAAIGMFYSGILQPAGDAPVQLMVSPFLPVRVALLSIPVGALAAAPTLWTALRIPIASAVRASL
jgi:putative ABC transport system permease protein